MPSREEPDQIHDAKDKGALKVTFNVTGSNPAGWYCSSSQNGFSDAWGQCFSNGYELSFHLDKYFFSSLRCVRG